MRKTACFVVLLCMVLCLLSRYEKPTRGDGYSLVNRVFGLELSSDNADILYSEVETSIDPIDIYHYALPSDYLKDVLRDMKIDTIDNNDVLEDYVMKYISFHEGLAVFPEILRKDTTCTYIVPYGGSLSILIADTEMSRLYFFRGAE